MTLAWGEGADPRSVDQKVTFFSYCANFVRFFLYYVVLFFRFALACHPTLLLTTGCPLPFF